MTQNQGIRPRRILHPGPLQTGITMNQIIYIVGAIVIVVALLGFLGLR
jgi:hypothetical protein